MREQQGVFGGVPMTRPTKPFSKSPQTPSFRVSFGQVAFGGDGVTVGGDGGVEAAGGVLQLQGGVFGFGVLLGGGGHGVT